MAGLLKISTNHVRCSFTIMNCATILCQAPLIGKGVKESLCQESRCSLGGNGPSSPYRIHRLCNWSILRDWDAGIPVNSGGETIQKRTTLAKCMTTEKHMRVLSSIWEVKAAKERRCISQEQETPSLPEISHCQRLGPHFGHGEDSSTVDTIKKMLKGFFSSRKLKVGIS